jgi:hypothetical protein
VPDENVIRQKRVYMEFGIHVSLQCNRGGTLSTIGAAGGFLLG